MAKKSKPPSVRGKDSLVKVAAIHPNPWNPNEQDAAMFEEQKGSLRKYDFLCPIVVRELRKGSYEIIDGEHRWRAAQDEGMTSLPVWNLGKVSDMEAKQLTEVFIHLHGESDPVKEARLLLSLREEHKLPLDKMAASLPFGEERIERLCLSLRFDWDQFEGEPSPDSSGSRGGSSGGGAKGALRFSVKGMSEAQYDLLQQAILVTAEETGALALTAICQFYLDYEGKPSPEFEE